MPATNKLEFASFLLSTFYFLLLLGCAIFKIRRKRLLWSSTLNAIIIEPTLELREADAGSGANLYGEFAIGSV